MEGYGVVISGMVLDPSEDKTHLVVVERVLPDTHTLEGVCSKIRVEPFHDASLVTQDYSLYTCVTFLSCIVLLIIYVAQRTG